MPRPALNAAVNRAVTMVVNGMQPRQAWDACGQPNGEQGIQNIRTRARKELLRGPVGSPSNDESAASNPQIEQSADSSGSARKSDKCTFRLKPDQLQKKRDHETAMKEKYDEIYSAATKEWAEMVSRGTNGKGDASADAVATRYRQLLPQDCKLKLTGRSLKNAVTQGRVGKPPAPRNKRPAIPDAFVRAIAEYSQLKQVNGDEQHPRNLMRVAVASAKGTAWETNLERESQKRYLMARVRREMCIGVACSKAIDNRRWTWLTSSNLKVWFAGYVGSLAHWKYIPGVPENEFEVIMIPETNTSTSLGALLEACMCVRRHARIVSG